MKELIGTIIDRFGPRLPASDAEAAAQKFLAGRLAGFCHRVLEEPFKVAVGAKFGSLKLFTVAFVAALVLFRFVSVEAGLILGLVNAVLFLGHFMMYRDWLDPLWPKSTSTNVIGEVDPKGEVKRTLIFTAHMDSTLEFRWWYWLGWLSIYLHIGTGALIAMLPLFFAIGLALPAWQDPLWWGLVAASPTMLSFFFFHGSIAVDGAQDNLSGVAVAVEAARRLASEPLEHTRIRVVSFGSEECGLKGSKAYVAAHHAELVAEQAVAVNLDGILLTDPINVVRGESFTLVRYPEKLAAELVAIFREHGIEPRRDTLPIGATDGTSFARRGIPVATIIGQSIQWLHPTYHTRLDTIDNIRPEALELVTEVLCRFARARDARAGEPRHQTNERTLA